MKCSSVHMLSTSSQHGGVYIMTLCLSLTYQKRSTVHHWRRTKVSFFHNRWKLCTSPVSWRMCTHSARLKFDDGIKEKINFFVDLGCICFGKQRVGARFLMCKWIHSGRIASLHLTFSEVRSLLLAALMSLFSLGVSRSGVAENAFSLVSWRSRARIHLFLAMVISDGTKHHQCDYPDGRRLWLVMPSATGYWDHSPGFCSSPCTAGWGSGVLLVIMEFLWWIKQFSHVRFRILHCSCLTWLRISLRRADSAVVDSGIDSQTARMEMTFWWRLHNLLKSLASATLSITVSSKYRFCQPSRFHCFNVILGSSVQKLVCVPSPLKFSVVQMLHQVSTSDWMGCGMRTAVNRSV